MHAYFLQMGGFKVNYTIGNKFFSSHPYRFETKMEGPGIVVQESVLSVNDLWKLLEEQLINFPDTTAEEIKDRRIACGLLNGPALLLITLFIMHLIARAHQQLYNTAIELMSH